jgi:hypothetical protein
VEVALVAPVLVLLIVGMLAVAQEITVSNKVSASASTMADLIAQARSVTNTDLGNIVLAGSQILYPDPADGAVFAGRIICVNFKAAGAGYQASVGWEYDFGTAPGTAPDLSGLTRLAQPGVSVIFVSLIYTYRPAIPNPIFDHIDIARTAVARPRLNTTVPRV